MRKFLLFLFVLFVVPAFAGAFDLPKNDTLSEEQNKLTTELNTLKQESCNLYGLVEKELSAYYGKQGIKDFYDPNHQTGWFRVYDFLSWLKANETELIDKFAKEADLYNYSVNKEHLKYPLRKYCSLKTLDAKGFLGVFLGKEYLLSKYIGNKKLTYNYIPIGKLSQTLFDTAAISVYTHKVNLFNLPRRKQMNLPNNISLDIASIGYEEKAGSSFAGFINIAIHETMHGIGIFIPNNASVKPELLIEMFTIYAQMAYALPVKKGEEFFSGTRDLYNLINSYPYDAYKNEYNDALFAYIQFSDLKAMTLEDMVKSSWNITHDFSRSKSLEGISISKHPNFFEYLLESKETGKKLEKGAIRENSNTKILFEDTFYLFVEEGSSANLYCKYNKMAEIIMEPIDFKEYLENVDMLFPGYEQIFENLSKEYTKVALKALYGEHDFNKFETIYRNPLKYVLKKNKAVPPTPKGYI